MEYYAHVVGEGYGCDYTIGCNHAWVDLQKDCTRQRRSFSSLGEARERVVDLLLRHDEYGSIGVDFIAPVEKIASIVIYEVTSSVELDMGRIKCMKEALVNEAEGERKLEKMRAEYERLKAILGKEG